MLLKASMSQTHYLMYSNKTKLNKLRQLKSNCLDSYEYQDTKINELDNVFTNATKEDFDKVVTLSAFSRPEKYSRFTSVRTPNPTSRSSNLTKLMAERK